MDHLERCEYLAKLEVTFFPERDKPLVTFDPRFESLRGEHEWVCYEDSEHWCAKYGFFDKDHESSYCTRTDSDALDAAAEVWYGDKVFSGIAFAWCRRDDGYDGHYTGDGWEGPWAHGESREEARSAALVAAVKAEA